MPAALEVDKEQVRIIALAVGVREAARQFGLSEGTVSYWSAKEGWMDKQEQVEAAQAMAIERVKSKQGVQAVPSGAQVMEGMNGETRYGHAVGAHKVAQKIQTMDADELFLSAPLLAQHAKHAQAVFGWAQNVTGAIRLDVLASCSSDQAPVLDV